MKGLNVTDVLTKEQRHKNMQRITCKDTKPELLLRKEIWKAGLRYRKNYSKLVGKPDIVITKYKIAIFVDGDFWHAHNHLDNPGEQIKTNSGFWKKKLRENVERDREINSVLVNQGWLVLRFWESDIKKNISKCVNEILSYVPCKKK